MTYKDRVKNEWNKHPLQTLMLAIIVVILIIMAYRGWKNGEKFAPSYSAGADQRFQQINTDPSLGKQFGPYNDEIVAREVLLGNERLASSREAPVVYNYGRDQRNFQAPRDRVPPAMRAGEAGLSNPEDMGVNGEGTPHDNDVEELMSELYG